MTELWHPYADMSQVPGREIVLDRGEGVWIWDKEQRRYLDATAGLWYCNIGHGRKELAQVAMEQMGRLAHYSVYDVFESEAVRDAARRLVGLAPMKDAAVFFTSTGSDAVETAAKLVRRYWSALGEPQRQTIVTRADSYHGASGYGTSLGGIAANTKGFGGLIPDVVHVDRDDLGAVEGALEERPGRVAAVFAELVSCAGGVYPSSTDYLTGLERVCSAHNVLLVVDEVITAFARLGYWFACERWGIEPDAVICAKGLTSGYMPLGAVIVGARMKHPFWAGDAGLLRHGYTYSGHFSACAVASQNIEVISRERLRQHVLEIEGYCGSALAGLGTHPLVADVRSIGLVAGVELDAGVLASDVGLTDRIVKELRANGVLSRFLVGRVLQVSPPLVISRDEIDFLAAAIDDALDAASRSKAGPAA